MIESQQNQLAGQQCGGRRIKILCKTMGGSTEGSVEQQAINFVEGFRNQSRIARR